MQKEQQLKLKQTVEELKQKEATATRKQQELTACLSLGDYAGGSLQKGGDRVYFQVMERKHKTD